MTQKLKQFWIEFKVNKIWWAVLLLILIGFSLRIYNFPQMFFYTMDEEIMNLIQRQIVLGIHYPLIGSVSPLNTYLGPIFYYFGALILGISNLNPLGLGIFSTILGTLNILFIYFVASRLFNQKIGLIAAAIFTFSFLQVILDRRYWHLTPGPVLSLLVLYSIYKIKKGSIKFIYLLTAALIFGWNTDYTNLILFAFTFVCWIVFRLPIKRKEVLIAIMIFLVSNLPLVVFDLRHDFLNSKALVSYLTTKHKTSQVAAVANNQFFTREEQLTQTVLLPYYTFSRAIFTASDLNIAQQQTYCKAYIFERNRAQDLILPGLAAVIIASFLYLTYKNRRSKEALAFQLISLFFVIFQLGIALYAVVFKGDIFEHYLVTLLPYLYIMLAVVLYTWIYKKVRFVFWILLAAFILANIYLNLSAYNPYSFQNKLDATKYALDQVGDQPFSLDSLSSCYRWDGFYYPFILMGNHPQKSYQDPNYFWIYDYQIPEKNPAKIVVMVPKAKYEDSGFLAAYQKYQPYVESRKTFGVIEVLIINNQKGEF